MMEGIIKSISVKQGGKNAFVLEGGTQWYNGFGMNGAVKGDKIKFDVEVNGTWHNFKNITVLDYVTPEAEIVYNDGNQELFVNPPGKILSPTLPVVDTVNGTVKGTVRKSVSGSAYEKDPVGLAIEVYCPMFEYYQGKLTSTELMNQAIEVVKQAQEAFS